MSIIRCLMNGEGEDVFEPLREYPCRDLIQKFRDYRSKAEEIDADNKEQKEVINRLKDDIKTCQEIEKTQSSRLLSVQSRLDCLEDKRRMFYKLSVQQRESEESIRKIDQALIDVASVIGDLQEKCRSLVSSAVQDMDLIKENRALREELDATKATLSQIKSELESTMKDKDVLTLQYEARYEELRNQLNATRDEANEIRDHSNVAITFYREQLTEYENKIAEMETERKRILLDKETLPTPVAIEKRPMLDRGFPPPDSTVSCIAEESGLCDGNRYKTINKTDASTFSQGRLESASVNLTPLNKRKFSQPGLKRKLPPSAMQDTNATKTAASSQPQPKRHLYSSYSDPFLK